jgi:hypothetical protein
MFKFWEKIKITKIKIKNLEIKMIMKSGKNRKTDREKRNWKNQWKLKPESSRIVLKPEKANPFKKNSGRTGQGSVRPVHRCKSVSNRFTLAGSPPVSLPLGHQNQPGWMITSFKAQLYIYIYLGSYLFPFLHHSDHVIDSDVLKLTEHKNDTPFDRK